MKRLVLFVVTILAASVACAAENRVGPTPWHLSDLWWHLGTNAPFESYSIDVTIMDDVPADTRLYVAPVGLGKLNGLDFYGGLQTHSDGRTKDNPAQRGIGRGIILSRWGDRRIEGIRPAAPGGYFLSAGNEGDYVSARAPYEWTKGKYTYRIAKMDRGMLGEDKGTWFGGFVYSHEKHENAFIGSIWFKGESFTLDKDIASFVEIYGARIPVSNIPPVRIRFDNLCVNGVKVADPHVDAMFEKGIPDIADVTWKDGGVDIAVNPTNDIVRKSRYYRLR